MPSTNNLVRQKGYSILISDQEHCFVRKLCTFCMEVQMIKGGNYSFQGQNERFIKSFCFKECDSVARFPI